MSRPSARERDRILSIWDELDDGEISTERLFAMTSERASKELRREIDDGDVADALSTRAS